MQVFRLVNAGQVDKMIAFKSLPKRLLSNIRTRDVAGMPRYWAKWLVENECVRECFKTSTEVLADRNLKVTKTPIGTEPCFYLLDYTDINNDKEKWQEIGQYVRRTVDPTTRLMDRLEDMALKMADTPYTELKLEPEEIPVIEVPLEAAEKVDLKQIVKSSEEVMTPTGEAVKRRAGRPKKIAVEA